MNLPLLTLACVPLLLALPSTLAQSSVVTFQDDFDDGDLLVNPGLGGGWIRADQGPEPDPGVTNAESGGTAIIGSSAGGWNIGGIKTTNSFVAGSTVTVTFHGLEVVDGSSSPADRGNGLFALIQGQISIADSANTEAFPSAFKNDGRPAINIELQEADGLWGFDIQRQGGGNNSAVTDSAGVFDDAISDASPLEVTLTVLPDGAYSITFNKTYDGGMSDPLTGSLGAGFSQGHFIVALGAQGINDNTGNARFGSVSIASPESLQITRQPADQRVLEGDSVTFSVAATGTGALQYQWLRGSTPLEGATDSELTLTNLQPSDAGEYFVRVTDASGSVTSNPATLIVRAIVTAFDDDFADNNPETNSGTGGGWLQASQADPYSPHEESGSAVTLYSGPSGWAIGGLQTVNALRAGDPVRVTITGFQLTGDYGFRADRGLALSGAAIGHVTLADARNPNPYPNAYANAELGALDVEIVLRDDGGAGYDVRVPVFDNNPNSHGDTFTQSGELDWDGSSPFDVTVTLSSNGNYVVRFSIPHDGGSTDALVGTVGKEVPAVAAAIGAQGVGDNTAALSVGRVQIVESLSEPPVIGIQPSSTLAIATRSATFSVVAVGSEPLTYQWRRGATPIPGAQSSTLTLSGLTDADAGEYSVVVSNAFGEVVSDIATLVVYPTGILFEDTFDGSDPFTNTGTGGDWVLADQGGAPDDGVDYSESDGVVRLPSSSGSWNIGGIKTTNIFPVGAKVTVVLKGIEIVDGSGDGADRGNGILGLVQAQVSVTDAANAEAFPSAYKNDGKPAMNIEIQSNGEEWGFDIQRQGAANNSSSVDSAGRFDRAIDAENPLTLTVVVEADGSYEVTFSTPYGDGQTEPLRGSLGRPFAGGAFLFALGSQGINSNTGYSLFDSASVIAAPASEPASEINVARDGADLVFTWEGNAILESADTVTGPWSEVPAAQSGHRVVPSDAAAFYRLRAP